MTTTTSPRAASRAPLYQGTEPLPLTNAPPWIQNSTGRAASSAAGVNTLRYKQSSSVGMLLPLPPRNASIPPSDWTELARCFVQSSTPSHAATGDGALKRSGPTGGAAYGTPRNWSTPAFS